MPSRSTKTLDFSRVLLCSLRVPLRVLRSLATQRPWSPSPFGRASIDYIPSCFRLPSQLRGLCLPWTTPIESI